MSVHDTVLQLLVAAAHALFVIALIAATFIFYILILGQIRAYRSPIRNLPGPKKGHWLYGNFPGIHEPDSTRMQEEWVRTYGHVIRYHSRFGVRSSTAFIQRVVCHPTDVSVGRTDA